MGQSSVNSLSSTTKGLVSGGKDGTIKLWDNSLNKIQEYSMNDATPKPYRSCVRSVMWDVAMNKILVGTKGSEIYEISKDSKRTILLNEGHCADELWGLSTHPANDDLFVTAGDDKTVRIWSISKRRMLKKAVLDTMARAVDWSPDGFTVAIGSQDNNIYLHDVNSSFSVRAMCTKHNKFITDMDFSVDSATLQSNCGGYELLFYNTIDGTQNPSASSVKNVEWASWTCPLGWPVQGIWQEEDEGGANINSVHRSNSKDLVAAADELGRVKMYNYPCLESGAAFVEGRGHSSHVTAVRFNKSDSYLMTVGGTDRTVCVWKLKPRQ